MAKDSYNSVGAGAKPRLMHGKAPSCIFNDVQDGGQEGMGHVKVSVDIPKAARPGGSTQMPQSAGSIPQAARPGGSQEI